MSETKLNITGLQYFYYRLKTVFATKNSLIELAARVDDIISRGGLAYKYKGSVATYNNLPSNPAVGDMYNVKSLGKTYVWSGSSWDDLGTLIDVSELWERADLAAMTTAEIDAITTL